MSGTSTPNSSHITNERTSLLRPPHPAQNSYYSANDSSFTRFAASTAVAVEAEGAADPTEDHGGKDGRLEGDDRVRGKERWLILIGLWASNFSFALQSSAIPTLAPRISASFEHSELASYLGSIFPLFSTAFTPVYGVLLDSLGRKWAMGIAAFFFGFGTLLCGLAPSMSLLIAARAFSGIGGSGLLTVSSVITTDLIALRDRGYYQGLMMIAFGLGSSLGAPLSGWIADNWSWPWAFYVELPFLVISMIIIIFRLPATKFHPGAPTPPSPTLIHAFSTFDILGTLILLVSISSFMLGLTNHTGKLHPWSSPWVWGLLAIAAVGTVAFLITEARVKNPVMPLSTFKGWRMASLYSSNFMLSVASSSFLYHIPVFFTNVLGSSSAKAGLHLLPNSIGLAIGSILAGQYIRRTGRYAYLSAVGLAMPIVGIFMASRWTERTQAWEYWAEIFPSGLGYSIFLCCSLVALISGVAPADMPKSTSVLYTIRSLGGTVGIAASSAVQQGALVRGLRTALIGHEDIDGTITAMLHSKSNLLKLPPLMQVQAEAAYAQSLSIVFFVASLAAVGTFVLSLPTGENDLGERKKKNKKKKRVVVQEDEEEV